MNKVTLSVAALAAIAVPVQAQVLTGDAKKAAVEDVMAYINEAEALVKSFGYTSVCQQYLDKLDGIRNTFNTNYGEDGTQARKASFGTFLLFSSFELPPVVLRSSALKRPQIRLFRVEEF